jgi:hypothetical protein
LGKLVTLDSFLQGRVREQLLRDFQFLIHLLNRRFDGRHAKLLEPASRHARIKDHPTTR